jgi:hypothetical protein
MNTIDTTSRLSAHRRLSPLEEFVRRYAEQVGGGYDEIEPQVYDLLLDEQILRVTFDPEALTEHPDAQLAALGSPLLESMFNRAAAGGATAVAHVQGLNLHPHDLPEKLNRAYVLPDKTTWTIDRVRAMAFPQCVCWFEFTFESDQREQELLQVAIDLASGRQVRQIDRLMDANRLFEQAQDALPSARCRSVREGCLLAAEQAMRTAQALANARRRELDQRLASLATRMDHYYDQMLGELTERATKDETARKKLATQRVAIEQERALRLAEARKKHALRVMMRPVNLLMIFLPKLQVSATWAGTRGRIAMLAPVFDPLLDSLEPLDCPACHRPTLELRLDFKNQPKCPQCA